MSLAMPAILRKRLRMWLVIMAVSAAIGVAFGLLSADPGPAAPKARLVFAAIAAVHGILTGAIIAAIEIFPLRAAARHLLQVPFFALVALKTLAYGAIVLAVLAGSPGVRLVSLVLGRDLAAVTPPPTSLVVGFSLGVTLIFVLMMQSAQLLGFRTFRDLFLGRYRTPRRERRFFLFVDVVGSTAIAERLGPLEAHRFLAAVFAAVAEPVAACRGEIYQYVGDEIVVTWTEAEGALEVRPLRCFFLMETSLLEFKDQFRRQFAAAPRLRAALHFGEVIAGEVGVWRRAIVFHGDVMNTASRLEQATREVGQRFIVSAEALRALGPLPELRSHDLGALALRGRKEPIRAYGIERLEGAAG